MQSHLDGDFRRDMFMDRLKERAEEIRGQGKSQITGGRDGEEPLTTWKRRGLHVTQLPDDEQGILRISIGGGSDTPVELNYCTFRGKHSKCVDLLRKALVAMQEGPEE
jgi:hypothetical protein